MQEPRTLDHHSSTQPRHISPGSPAWQAKSLRPKKVMATKRKVRPHVGGPIGRHAQLTARIHRRVQGSAGGCRHGVRDQGPVAPKSFIRNTRSTEIVHENPCVAALDLTMALHHPESPRRICRTQNVTADRRRTLGAAPEDLGPKWNSKRQRSGTCVPCT